MDAVPRRLLRSGPPPESPAGTPALACGQEAREEPVSTPHRLPPLRRLFAVPGHAGVLLRRLAGPAADVDRSAWARSCWSRAQTGSYALAGAVAGTLALCLRRRQPAVGPGHGPAGSGRGAAAGHRRLPGLRAGVRRRGRPGAPHWTWFAARRRSPAPAAPTSARSSAPGGPTRCPTRRTADRVRVRVGGRRGGLRRRPAAVTFLATLIAPPVGFLTGLLIGFGGGLWLARLRATAPPVHRASAAAPHGGVGLLPRPGWSSIAVTYLAVGTVFGAMDVVVVGFADAEGAPALRRGRAGRLRRRQPGRRAGLRHRPAARARSSAASSGTRAALRRRRPGAAPGRLAAGAGRHRVPRRADHRPGARRRDVPGGVPGAPRRR